MNAVWDDLTLHFLKEGVSPTRAPSFSAGVAIGIALSFQHPEWAEAFRQAGITDYVAPWRLANESADALVRGLPVEVTQ